MPILKTIINGMKSNGEHYHWESTPFIGEPQDHAQWVADLRHEGIEAKVTDVQLEGVISIPLGQRVEGLDYNLLTYSEEYVIDGMYACDWTYSEGNATLSGWEIVGN